MSTSRDIGPADLVEQGQSFYEGRLRSILDPEHTGEFVAIEPSTGQYFLGATATAALIAARTAMPDCLFFVTRVGRTSAHTIGGHASRIR